MLRYINHTNICGKFVSLNVTYHLYVAPGCIYIKVTKLSELSSTLNLVILAILVLSFATTKL